MVKASPAIKPQAISGSVFSIPTTIFLGSLQQPVGGLLELRLLQGRWASDPVVSGGNFSNRTDESIYVKVQDFANITALHVDVSGVREVGEPVELLAIVTREGRLVSEQRFVLGYRAGAALFEIPFFNPSTNDRQETFIFVGAVNDDAKLRIFGTDNAGTLRGPAVFNVAAHTARTITAKQIEDAGLGAPVGKFRLVIGSDAPVSVVGKVRNGFDQTITENPAYPFGVR